MAYKDKEKQRMAVAKAARKYRAKVKGITQGMTVSQGEIDALPQALKDDINQLCDSDPVMYADRDERFIRAVLYRRKFPDTVYHASWFTGTMTDFEREYYEPASELGQGEYNPVSKPGDEHYAGVATGMAIGTMEQ